MCNVATANPGLLSRRVADLFLPPDLPPATTEPPPDNSPEVAVPEATLKRYAGLYWNQATAVARPVVLEGGKLHAVNGRERIALKSIGGGTFVMTGGPRTRVTFEEGTNGDMQLKVAGGAQAFVKTEPFTPSPEQLAEFAGVYRSDEMDAVFRMSLKDGALLLVRSKLRPSPLEPLIKDTFRAQPGIVQFNRDAAGRVTGFTLESGRVKRMKFWKDTTPPRPSTTASR